MTELDLFVALAMPLSIEQSQYVEIVPLSALNDKNLC